MCVFFFRIHYVFDNQISTLNIVKRGGAVWVVFFIESQEWTFLGIPGILEKTNKKGWNRECPRGNANFLRNRFFIVIQKEITVDLKLSSNIHIIIFHTEQYKHKYRAQCNFRNALATHLFQAINITNISTTLFYGIDLEVIWDVLGKTFFSLLNNIKKLSVEMDAVSNSFLRSESFF